MTNAQTIAAIASMYFGYDCKSRPEVTAKTTFEAIKLRQRTSTTRFSAWPGYTNWLNLKPGDVVRLFADKQCCGEFIDCVVDSKTIIDLARCSDAAIEEWSKAEGWIAAEGRRIGRRYGLGLQVRYHLLKGGTS